jgi:hypothetical protein
LVSTKNQNPEQIARDQIDEKLAEAGWAVQAKNAIDFKAGLRHAGRYHPLPRPGRWRRQRRGHGQLPVAGCRPPGAP